MRRRATILALAALLAASFVQAAAAEAAKEADPRVVAVLDRLGLHYTVNSSGNIVVTYDEDKGRSQSVFIMSATDTYSGIEIREIWSNAGAFDAAPEAEVLIDLMTESGKNKIGSWALEETDAGKYLLFYTIKFPADASDDAYRMMLEFASSIADERELALFDSDEN
jgi:hypothetical protein